MIVSNAQSFIVRIWWESDLTRPDGRSLWRGRVQHVASGRTQGFQSLEDLLRFIRLWAEVGDDGEDDCYSNRNFHTASEKKPTA